MPGLPKTRKFTQQSRHAADAHLVSRGPLLLNVATGYLTGPAGSVFVCDAERVVLRLLLQPRLVPAGELIEAAFPPGVSHPHRPLHALAMRLARLRVALERVGVSPAVLRNHSGEGWSLGVGADQAEIFGGARLEVLNLLLASHPDRRGVALLK